MIKANEDILKTKRKIVRAIIAYGFSPDHNYFNYLYSQTAGKKCVFFDFGKSRGVIAFYSKNKRIWRVINGVFAPEQERLHVFMEFLNWAFRHKNARKVFVEFPEELKKDLYRKLRGSFRLNAGYCLHWPIYSLDNIDGEMKGKEWKKLRNIRNRFLKGNKIEVKDPRKVSKDALRKVLMSWVKKRYQRDRANMGYYMSIIRNNFRGFDVLRSVSVNGEVCSFSGGWMVPNSSDFYYSIGIFNYSHKNLGDFVNLDDLLHVKKLGFKQVELGGSDEATILFKKKFNPVKIYKTYFFSIVPK